MGSTYRSGSPCTCGAPENNCTGLAHLFSDDSCSGGPESVSLPSGCRQGGPVLSMKLVSANSAAPSCRPTSVSKPTGSVTPDGLATICCAH